jgi:hypothetical protein
LRNSTTFQLTSVETSSTTLRALLGDDLIHSISSFVNVAERERSD